MLAALAALIFAVSSAGLGSGEPVQERVWQPRLLQSLLGSAIISPMDIELALAAIRAARLGEADPDPAGFLKRGAEVWRTFRLQSTGWLVYVTVLNEDGNERYEVSKRRPWPL